MRRYPTLAIANEFLARSMMAKSDITHMQLQKLVYLAHGWNLAINGSPLVEDRFEAWPFGPVVRKLYDALSRYGRRPIDRYIRWGDDTPFPSDDDGVAECKVTAAERAVIDKVWNVFGGFEAFKLSALTHAEGSPWHKTYSPMGKNRPIDDNDIRDYFVKIATQNKAA